MLTEYIPLDDFCLFDLGEIGHACRNDGISVVSLSIFRQESNETLQIKKIRHHFSMTLLSFNISLGFFAVCLDKAGRELTEKAGMVAWISTERASIRGICLAG